MILVPSWLCRLGRWLKVRPYRIRFWLQRANGKIPEIDCWQFNITLVSTIEQALSWMLYKGYSKTWGNEESELKQRSDLVFVKNVMWEFLYYYQEGFSEMIDDAELYYAHAKRLEKAMAIMSKYFWGLWD